MELKVHKNAWEEQNVEITPEHKVYKLRWVMLGLFSALSLTNAICWITYSPIARYVMEHYNISLFQLNSLSFVYMIVYIPVMYFSSWLIDVRGMRIGMILAAVLNCIGSWVRYIGKDSDKFYLAVIGQTILALAQTLILGVPPKLAANWFPTKERARATSIGALFNEVGIATGFLLSPSLVKNTEDIPNILLVTAIMCSAVGFLVIIGFRGKPPTPPSVQAAAPKEDFKKAIRLLLANKSFVILVIAFGSTIGAYYAIATVLDQVIEPAGYSSDDAGWLGFVTIMTGIVGAFVVGWIADKTHKYKLLLLITYIGTFGVLIGFLLSVRPNFYGGLYTFSALFGIFITSILPVSLEGAAECAFPVTEAISGGVTMMSAQTFGILFIVILSLLADYKIFSLLTACWGLLFFVGASCILVCFFRENRIQELQEMEKEHSSEEPATTANTVALEVLERS